MISFCSGENLEEDNRKWRKSGGGRV